MDPLTRKTTKLRQLITRPELVFLLEAHDGLSAKIVEDAGFEGIWASGLTVSASFGCRDNNELSWSQVTDHVGFMADGTSIPILLDGDTGYGNFNNMRRLVRRLEQIGVGGVTIEDKVFPKTNSFLRAEQQPLADIDEFCGKIKAGKDSQTDGDFVLVARVEALIAGWGLGEAMKRAEAYHLAGADAILIHSKSASPAEVFAFIDEWANRAPVVLVPTKYGTTPAMEFRARKVSVVIWANHLLRAAIGAMQVTARHILKDECLLNVESQIVPLSEVFRLQGDDELQEAERRYLPAGRDLQLSAVVLAAAGGTDFGALTDTMPKAMLKVRGQPILARLLDDFGHFGCRFVTVVRGYQAEAVKVPAARFVDNTEFGVTGEAYSLSLAEDELKGGTLVSFGDIVVKRHIIHALLEEAGDGLTIMVGAELAGTEQPDRVLCNRLYSDGFTLDAVSLLTIGQSVPVGESHGAWIGLLHLGAEGAAWMLDAIAEARTDGTLRTARVCDLLTRVLAKGHPVRVVYTYGGWVNVNNITDLIDASAI
jgi:phosphoenolpyruvate phosphomutase